MICGYGRSWTNEFFGDALPSWVTYLRRLRLDMSWRCPLILKPEIASRSLISFLNLPDACKFLRNWNETPYRTQANQLTTTIASTERHAGRGFEKDGPDMPWPRQTLRYWSLEHGGTNGRWSELSSPATQRCRRVWFVDKLTAERQILDK